jgi:hypothetical protein
MPMNTLSRDRPPQSKAVLVGWIDDGRIVVHTPYGEDFVKDWKAQIPQYLREWQRTERVWYVHVKALETVCILLMKWFGWYSIDVREMPSPICKQLEEHRERHKKSEQQAPIALGQRILVKDRQ